MKLLISTFLFLFSILSYAQEHVQNPVQKELATQHLKNTVLSIDNQNYDYRILKHYSEQDLREMNPIKRNQIQYIYTQSYRVVNPEACTDFSITNIDIAKLEVFRKKNTSTEVEIGSDCKVKVELYSRDSVDEALTQLSK